MIFGPAAEMNEMPVGRVSIVARILTHRRDDHPIGKRPISNRERIKQASHEFIELMSLGMGPRETNYLNRMRCISMLNIDFDHSTRLALAVTVH